MQPLTLIQLVGDQTVQNLLPVIVSPAACVMTPR